MDDGLLSSPLFQNSAFRIQSIQHSLLPLPRLQPDPFHDRHDDLEASAIDLRRLNGAARAYLPPPLDVVDLDTSRSPSSRCNRTHDVHSGPERLILRRESRIPGRNRTSSDGSASPSTIDASAPEAQPPGTDPRPVPSTPLTLPLAGRSGAAEASSLHGAGPFTIIGRT